MKAKLTIVYTEKQWVRSEYYVEEPDAVFVEIRRYNGGYGHLDVVMESYATVDGDRVAGCKKVLDYNLSNAELQRIGIAEFDSLKEAHPAALEMR